MVASVNSDLYTPFTQGSMPEESGPSSEEGSGLHSPIFPVQYTHGDSNLRYHPESIDIQNAAGVLASQFEYTGMPHHDGGPPPPLLDASLDRRSIYPNEYQHPPPPRSQSQNQLGLDIPPQTLSNTRLPPPPTHGGQVFFASSPDRAYAEDPHAHGGSYGPSSAGLPMDGNTQQQQQAAGSSSSNPTSAQPGSAPRQGSATSGGEPRKETSGVVIACRQCRARKIRCDSTRPVCNNCVRRSNECQYDAAPKRRGPDKRPGTRQRSCKKRPADGSAPPPPSKRKRTGGGSGGAGSPGDVNGGGSPGDVKENMASMKSTFSSQMRSPIIIDESRSHMHSALSSPSIELKPPRGLEGTGMFPASNSPTSRRGPISPYDHHPDPYSKSFRPLDVNVRSEMHDNRSPVTPSMEYPRKHWWDTLLDTYAGSRDDSLRDIISDLSSLFNNTSHWLSFIHVPTFVGSLYIPEDRTRMQPALVYAGLALATFIKSSTLEHGNAGTARAMWLRDAAQNNLENSLSSNWIDVPLAEAALILALFESSAHPMYSPGRAASALGFLDNIIRRLQLTTIDHDDPEVSSFKAHAVPSIKSQSHGSPRDVSRKCTCIPLPPNGNLPADHFSSSWSYAPPWDLTWSAAEMNKEECRRLCWSALTLIAGHASHAAAFDKEPAQFYMSDSANWALLFPGEISDRAHRSAQSPKDSVWALYCRTMLLWNFATRLNDGMSDASRAEYAYEVWVETQNLQDVLESHVCNLDTALLYMCREHIYNTRLSVTRILKRFEPSSPAGVSQHPVFSSKEADEWLYYEDQVIKRVKSSINHLGEAQGHLLTRRPFQVPWFTSQLAMCLSLWHSDRSLTNALELGKSVLGVVEILNALWPCQNQQTQATDLRKRLSESCTAAGVPQPLPAEFSLPAVLKAVP